MSQLTQKSSIKQAEVIEEAQSIFIKQPSSDDISETKKHSDSNQMPTKQAIQDTRIAPWRALFQYEKRSKEHQLIPENKTKSDKQQVLRKIKKQKSKTRSTKQKLNQATLSQPHRKMLPQQITDEDSKHEMKKMNPQTYLPKLEALNNLRQNKYRKKNYNFQDKITKIKDIKAGQSNINIKGQIIFVWEKQVINQRWAKTEMICAEVWDGSGAIVLAIPFKLAASRLWNLEIGKYVNIMRAQAKQKYPRRLCLLLNQKSQIKHLNRNQVLQSLIEPEKLGLSLKQLQAEPVGRICNIVCLIIHKQQKQLIRNARNADLSIRKIIAYDPIDKRTITIKLWQEKADLKFYTNAIVYLLRGIQVKQFKEVREYHASKDFNWRILGYSRIGEYLREFYDQRDTMMELVPSTLKKMNIKQSMVSLDKLALQENSKNKSQKKKEDRQNQHISPNQYKKQKIQPPTQPQTSTKNQQNTDLITNLIQQIPRNTYTPEILCSWSLSILKITSIELNSQVTIKYTKCSKCKSRTMRDFHQQSRCSKCSVSNSSTDHYSVKCEVYDGDENYLAEIMDQAGQKLFSIEDQVMKIGFLDQTNSIFKQRIAKQAIGDTIRAVTITTKQKIPGDIWLTGHYIADIVPFQNENTQETYNQSLISQGYI